MSGLILLEDISYLRRSFPHNSASSERPTSPQVVSSKPSVDFDTILTQPRPPSVPRKNYRIGRIDIPVVDHFRVGIRQLVEFSSPSLSYGVKLSSVCG